MQVTGLFSAIEVVGTRDRAALLIARLTPAKGIDSVDVASRVLPSLIDEFGGGFRHRHRSAGPNALGNRTIDFVTQSAPGEAYLTVYVVVFPSPEAVSVA